MFLSPYILAELTRHLLGKAHLDHSAVENAIDSLRAGATIVDPDPIPPDATRDPNDLPILGTAVASRATVLVSGDKDLFVLASYDSIPILPPSILRPLPFKQPLIPSGRSRTSSPL